MKRFFAAVAMLVFAGLTTAAYVRQAPALLLGDFEDDYRGRHTIAATVWLHGSQSRYHIVRWDTVHRFLIARNDSANPSAPGKWTRVDWLRLDGMPPYEWGFCFSAYEAPSAAVAETVSVAKPETPRTGCNGFPYSRMRRIAR